MYWNFFNMLTTEDTGANSVDLNTKKLEIVSSSVTGSVVASLSFFTLFINVWVCWRIYRKRSLRCSCIALIVANVALVDILVSIKDLPFLLSVSVSSKWYFEPEWCRSTGLTNVVYIIVSVSTLVSIATDRYIRTKIKENKVEKLSQGLASQPNNKVILLGYVIAQTTLSYSLSLLWSKYTFLSRKAFCLVEFSSSSFPLSMAVSFLFLIPIAILAFSMLNTISGNKTRTEWKCDFGNEDCNDADDEENQMYFHLQAVIGIFLISWCPYIVDSFFPSPESPSVPGIVSAFIPILTTSLMPLYFVLTHKRRATITYNSAKESCYLSA